MPSKSTALASAAALLFVAGAPVAHAAEQGKAEKIKCEGVNSCKGQSSCHSAQNECAGKNSCRGKGFKMMTPDECDQAKAKLKTQQDEG
jgi:uncharacterized membrane protein